MRIVLASGSPFRRYALDLLGLDYEVRPSDVDEKAIRHSNPRKLVARLSEAKALSVAEQVPDALVIGSDAVVSLNGEIFEKPEDEAAALQMLRSLSGNLFEFITGLVVYNTANKRKLSTVGVCEVRFRELLEHELHDYIERYPVCQCAGAFEYDGLLRFASEVNGSYNFRVALPVNELVLFLREQGVAV